jgi:hypothetical protein
MRHAKAGVPNTVTCGNCNKPKETAQAVPPVDVPHMIGGLSRLVQSVAYYGNNIETMDALASGSGILRVVIDGDHSGVKVTNVDNKTVEFVTKEKELELSELIFLDEPTVDVLKQLGARSSRFLASRSHKQAVEAVRLFVADNLQWTVVRQDQRDGLIILSRAPEDKKPKPQVVKQASNFVRSITLHVLDNPNKAAHGVYAERLATCQMCPSRTETDCAECGCDVREKAQLAGEKCPIGKWLAVSAPHLTQPQSRGDCLRNALNVFWRRVTGTKS